MKSDYSSRKIYCLLGTPLAAWIIVHLFMQWFWGILPPAPIGLPNPLPFSQFPGLGNSDSEVSPRGSSMGFHASDQKAVPCLRKTAPKENAVLPAPNSDLKKMETEARMALPSEEWSRFKVYIELFPSHRG